MKKVVLINPYPDYAKGINEATIYPPLGIAYLAAMLEKHHYICKIIDANILKIPNDEVFSMIKKFGADAVLISINITTAKAGNDLARKAKAIGKKVIMGGVHASSSTESTLRESGCDAIIVGESEETIIELMKKKCNPKGIAGCVYLEDGKMVHNGYHPLIQNLDDLPWPAYHLLPPLKLYRSRARKQPVAPMYTSRGCPFKCIFCSSSAVKSVFGSSFRTRSPENVVKEIQYLQKEFGVKQIDVLDDNFTFDMKRTAAICDLIVEKKIKILINLQSGVRADKVTRDLVFKLKKAGVYKTGIGIESGDQEIANRAKKALRLDQAKKAITWFREAGVVVYGFFVFGLPGDNEKTMQKTIDFAIVANPHIANFMACLPLPGTEMYDIVLKEGKFLQSMENGVDVGYYGGGYVYELGEVNPPLVNRFMKKAFREFYFRPSKIIDVMKVSYSPGELWWSLKTTLPILKNLIMKN